jgi:DNA polymerase III delta prime subunit
MSEKNRIIGHERQRSFLDRILRSPSHHHMMIFAGPSHVGKATIARAFAQAYIEGGGVTWGGIEKNPAHPDIILLSPRVEERKGVVKLKKISVGQVRRIIERASQTTRSGRRVLIVDDAHHMSIAAANALLKIIEEPPVGMYVVFVTSDRTRLLPTICSRGMTLYFGLYSREQMLGLEGINEGVADLAQSRPGIAYLMLTDEAVYEEALQSYEDLKDIRGWSDNERIAYAANLSKDSVKTQRYLELWLTRTRETAHAYRRPDYLLGYSQRIFDTLKILRTTNANVRMTLENMLIHF